MLEILKEEFAISNSDAVWRFLFRMLAAVLLGLILGWERERGGHFAGLRTHILVCLGCAVFTLIPVLTEKESANLAYLVKGIATGIGFLGAGAILKVPDEKRIEGLTTAGSIWLTAAIGVAVGTGWFWPAAIASVLGFLILRADNLVRVKK